jgi:hypothetical protein
VSEESEENSLNATILRVMGGPAPETTPDDIEPVTEDSTGLEELIIERMGGATTPPDLIELTPQTPSNLKHAMDKDPDRQAAVYQLAEALDASPTTVENNFDEAKKRQRLSEFEALKNPALSRFLANQENAEVSHDDIGVLSEIANHLGAFNSGVLSFPSTFFGGAGETMEIGKRKIKEYLPEGLAEFLTTPITLIEPEKGEKVKTLTDALFGAEEKLNEAREWLSPAKLSEGRTSMQVAGAIGQVASQIATMLVAPQMLVPTLFTSGVEQQAERQKQSGTYGESDSALVASGMVTATIEKLGLDKLLNRVPLEVKNSVMRKLTDVGIGGGIEALTEVTEAIGHNLIEKYSTNPDAKIFQGVEQEATVAGITGGIIRALLPSYRGNVKSKTTTGAMDVIQQTMVEQQFLDKHIKLLQESTTAKRSSKVFKRFEDDIGENTEVRINPAAFEGLQVPDYVKEQIDGLGSDVVVTMSQLAKDFVNNPELLKAARPHMRVNENTMTQNEVDTGAGDTIKNLMEEAKANAELKSEADAIFKDIVDQLVATGRMSKESARMNAVLIPAYITVKAKETGYSVAEIYKRMNLTITKAEPRVRPKPNFGDEKITTEDVLEETGQKTKVRELKQVVYDRTVKRLNMITKLRDCVNAN